MEDERKKYIDCLLADFASIKEMARQFALPTDNGLIAPVVAEAGFGFNRIGLAQKILEESGQRQIGRAEGVTQGSIVRGTGPVHLPAPLNQESFGFLSMVHNGIRS